jgi:xylitol oxidase
MPITRTNWAGNVEFRSGRVETPSSVAEIMETVRSADQVKVLGSGHSFNKIVDTDGIHLSLEKLRGIKKIDPDNRRVSIAGGARYADICPALDAAGFALNNLASLPHITVAGAVGTATHGSGLGNGNLATSVEAIEFVDASGALVRLTRQDDPAVFPGAVVGVGGLGIVTLLELSLCPRFEIAQTVYLDLPLSRLSHDFQAIVQSGYSVSLFTDWQRPVIDQVWVKRRVGTDGQENPTASFYGARAAESPQHPCDPAKSSGSSPQLGLPGPWFSHLPHFIAAAIPSNGEELQVEYFVDLENAVPAITRLAAVGDTMAGLLIISEIRVVAADELWLSPCYKRARVAFHFTFKLDMPAVIELLPTLEQALAPFEPVPHWGKLSTIPPHDVRKRYPKIDAFIALMQKHDPAGKFRNAFLDRQFGPIGDHD